MKQLHYKLIPCMVAALITIRGLGQQPFDLDPTFRTVIEAENVASILPLEDGNVILSGRIMFAGGGSFLSLAKVDAQGNQVQDFPITYGGGKITPWTDQWYVRTGQTVRRLYETGFVDPTFIGMNLGPYFSSNQGGDYHVYPDGRVLFSGSHMLSDTVRGFIGTHNLIWFSNQGYLDTTQTHRKSNATIWRIFPLPDGKFLLSGYFSVYEGQPVSHLIRVHPDGALDDTFQCSMWWGIAGTHHLLPNGQHLLGGSFQLTEFPGDTLGWVRLHPNGTVDTQFNNQLQFSATWAVEPASRGASSFLPLGTDRYVITGYFDRMDGQVRGGIALVDTAGTLTDQLFTGDGCGVYSYQGFNHGNITAIVPAPDGSFYIHGAYHGYDDGTTNDTQQRMVSRLYGLNVGVREHEETRMRMYPNPIYGPMSVQLPKNAQAQRAEIFDANGRMVWSASINAYDGRLQLDLSALSDGAYWLRCHMVDGAMRNGRFVIMK